MADKIIINLFKRFLKERNIFSRACRILIFNYESGIKKKETFLNTDTNPGNWIKSSRIFCYWVITSEGSKFWWKISVLWMYSLYEFSKKNKAYNYVTKNYLLSEIDLFTRSVCIDKEIIGIKNIILYGEEE